MQDEFLLFFSFSPKVTKLFGRCGKKINQAVKSGAGKPSNKLEKESLLLLISGCLCRRIFEHKKIQIDQNQILKTGSAF